MTKASQDEVRISAAVLRLAAKGWQHVTLASVAKGAKLPLKRLQELFSTPSDFVGPVASVIDREAFAAAAKVPGTPRDRLFDLLMARFDVLQKNRQAILHMAEAARHDRPLACALLRATIDGVYRLISAARLSTPSRPVLAAGITAIYSWAFWVWQSDKSPDMAKTMAALDRSLRLAEKSLTLFKKAS